MPGIHGAGVRLWRMAGMAPALRDPLGTAVAHISTMLAIMPAYLRTCRGSGKHGKQNEGYRVLTSAPPEPAVQAGPLIARRNKVLMRVMPPDRSDGIVSQTEARRSSAGARARRPSPGPQKYTSYGRRRSYGMANVGLTLARGTLTQEVAYP